MLVLNLHEGDYIMIGDDIRVYFNHKVSRDSLDIAIDAPKDISILRGKLYEKNMAEMGAKGDEKARALSHKLKKERVKRHARRS